MIENNKSNDQIIKKTLIAIIVNSLEKSKKKEKTMTNKNNNYLEDIKKVIETKFIFESTSRSKLYVDWLKGYYSDLKNTDWDIAIEETITEIQDIFRDKIKSLDEIIEEKDNIIKEKIKSLDEIIEEKNNIIKELEADKDPLSKKLNTLQNSEKQLLQIFKEYKDEIMLFETFQANIRREQAMFLSSTVKEVRKSLEESEIDKACQDAWIKELVDNYNSSLKLSSKLIDDSIMNLIVNIKEEIDNTINQINK